MISVLHGNDMGVLDRVAIWSPNDNVHVEQATKVQLIVEDPEVGNEVGDQHPARLHSTVPGYNPRYVLSSKLRSTVAVAVTYLPTPGLVRSSPTRLLA